MLAGGLAAIVAATSFGQAFGATPESGQADSGLYPLCEDLVPAWLQKKHLAGMSSQPTNLSMGGTNCIYSDGRRRVELVYNCIRGHTFQPRVLEPAEMAIPSLGRFAYRTMDQAGPAVVVLDDDTPCVISVNSKGGWTVDAMVPLARDLVKALTPQALHRETVEGLVWAIDESGTSPEDRMAVWQREGASVAAIFTLPAGFPQVTDLPPRVAEGKPRKTLVLGYLHHRSNYVFVAEVAKTFLPGIDVERFPAERRQPTAPPAMLNLGTTKTTTLAPGQQHLAVAFANSGQNKYENDLLIVFLPDAGKKLLDWKKLDLLKEAPDARKLLDPKRPEEEHAPLCTWAIEEKDQGIVAGVNCPRNPDPVAGQVRCKENPSWTLRWRMGAKDDKLKVERKRIVSRGKDCHEEGE